MSFSSEYKIDYGHSVHITDNRRKRKSRLHLCSVQVNIFVITDINRLFKIKNQGENIGIQFFQYIAIIRQGILRGLSGIMP